MVNIDAKDIGRAFAHIVLSAMFVYDIMINQNRFGWDNAGIYSTMTIGGEGLLAFARIRYGTPPVEPAHADHD